MSIRLSKAIKQLNIGIDTAYDFLVLRREELGQISKDINFKLNDDQYRALEIAFSRDKAIKQRANTLFPKKSKKETTLPTKGQSKESLNNESSNSETPIENSVNNLIIRARKSITIPLRTLQLYKTCILMYKKGSITYLCPISAQLSLYFEERDLNDSIWDRPVTLKITAYKDSDLGKFDLKEISLLEEKARNRTTISIKSNRKKKNKEKPKVPKNKDHNTFITVPLKTLVYGYRKIAYNKKGRNAKLSSFILKTDTNLSVLQQRKTKLPEFNKIVEIILHHANNSFSFLDNTILEKLTNIAVGKYGNKSDDRPVVSRNKILTIQNIVFHDYYYLIKDTTSNLIRPLKIEDKCSRESLRYVTKYLADQFPNNIVINYDNNAIISISEPYKVEDYVRLLYDNLGKEGEWWDDILESGTDFSTRTYAPDLITRKRIPLTKEYLIYLISLQSKRKKLIPTYEIRHGAYEYSFLFSIELRNHKYLVIHENISESSTSTEIFTVIENNYENCIQAVYQYFINESIENKRLTLQRKTIKPIDFFAESYFSIVHNGLEEWVNSINRIMEDNSIEPKAIKFQSGLRQWHGVTTRETSQDIIKTQDKHNNMIGLLYQKMCKQYGDNNVGTEIAVGKKRIDLVVKTLTGYKIYEIKTYASPIECIREALGQLCQYAFLLCKDNLDEMIIVGPTEPDTEVDSILDYWREKFNIPVSYIKI